VSGALTESTGMQPGHQVRMQVPAVTGFVGVLRATVAGLGARLDLDLDTVEDLRLAVSEAAALLLGRDVRGAVLDAEVTVVDDGLVVTLSAQVADTSPPSRESFAWTVLTALSHEASATTEGDRLELSLPFRRLVD